MFLTRPSSDLEYGGGPQGAFTGRSTTACSESECGAKRSDP